MLLIKHILDSKKLVLASSSPRRQELAKNINLNVSLCPSTYEEKLDPKTFDKVDDFVEETALQKVLEVEERLRGENIEADIIIGADTMVTHNNEIFGKPNNDNDAYRMLSRLSGEKNTVFTGVVVKYGSTVKKFTETTDVYMTKLTDEQIWAYIKTGEPLDKAGAYGIQGIGGTIIEKINGDYFTVMGLPLHRLSCTLYDLLKNEIVQK